MGQKDVLGYQTDIKEKQIIAARNAAIDLGKGKLALVQSFDGSYGHQIESVFETGSGALYMVCGNSQGSFRFGALVGTSGWFSIFNDLQSSACGTLKTITTTLGKELDCDPAITMNAAIKFEGALLRGINFSVQAGNLKIAQGGEFVCGKLLNV